MLHHAGDNAAESDVPQIAGLSSGRGEFLQGDGRFNAPCGGIGIQRDEPFRIPFVEHPAAVTGLAGFIDRQVKGRTKVAVRVDFQFQAITIFVLCIVTAVHGQFDGPGFFRGSLQTCGDV